MLRQTIVPALHVRWTDLTDLMNPYFRLQLECGILTDIATGKKYDATAVNTLKNLLIETAPYVYREPTEEEIDAFERITNF